MATPSSPIGFSDIYSEANGTTPGSATSLNTLAKQSYFTGPNGSNAISFNAWGQNLGIDGIYNVQALASTPIKFDDYRNVSYFYDQTNTQISLYIVNNGPPPPTGDFNITMYYMDSSLTYNYNVGGAFVPGGGNSFGPNEISSPGTPLIYGCNWKLQIDSNPFYTGGNFLNLFINGNLLINNDPIPPTFPAPVFWDYNTWGNEYMALNEPVGGATGSRIEIFIN
jgi:hypothetical protein